MATCGQPGTPADPPPAVSEAVEAPGGPRVPTTYGLCNECDRDWPCPTYVWATDGDRDPGISCWDPADDEDDEEAAP